jgi:hypothetical protein
VLQSEVYNAIIEEISNLRIAYERNPDPAEDRPGDRLDFDEMDELYTTRIYPKDDPDRSIRCQDELRLEFAASLAVLSQRGGERLRY